MAHSEEARAVEMLAMTATAVEETKAWGMAAAKAAAMVKVTAEVRSVAA